MLMGESGSGKSRLTRAIANKFQGYNWQKKDTNFQSKTLEVKSVIVVDEFDCEQLRKEKTLNDWKQRFDQEQSVYCDRKGVAGSNCTKGVPFFASTNSDMKAVKATALLRRVSTFRFMRSMSQFTDTIDCTRIP